MTDGFSQPASGGGFFAPKDALGHLVLITKVHDVYHNPTNVYQGKIQPRDEAKVDMVDLDGDKVHRERCIVTHPGLVNRLVVGASNVLGRIGQVPTDSGNDAYVLNKYQDADVPQAQAWVQAWQQGQFAQGQAAPQAGPQNAPPAQALPQVPAAAPAAPQVAPAAPQPAAPGLPPGVDAAALQALMAQLAAGQQAAPVQQANPPY